MYALNTIPQIALIEQTIVSLLKENNTKAMDLIYKHYSSALYGLVYKIIPDEEIAQDVLQQSFIKVWKNATTYDSTKGKLFTWLLNITRNTALDKLKSKEIKYAAKNYDDESIVYAIDSTSHTEQNTDTIGLKELVKQLSPEHRQLIDLMYFQGYTQVEIAEHIPMPLGTVKTKLRAAINQLRVFYKT